MLLILVASDTVAAFDLKTYTYITLRLCDGILLIFNYKTYRDFVASKKS